MRATIILAMIPLGVATAFLPRWPDPRPAVAETFVQRFEAVYPKHTFEERWWPGEGLPLPQASPPVDLLAPKVIRTIRITKDAVEPPQEVSGRSAGEGAGPAAGGARPSGVARANTEIEGRTVPSPVLRIKPRPIRVADICTRHGMHRVDYGRTWRCRR